MVEINSIPEFPISYPEMLENDKLFRKLKKPKGRPRLPIYQCYYKRCQKPFRPKTKSQIYCSCSCSAYERRKRMREQMESTSFVIIREPIHYPEIKINLFKKLSKDEFERIKDTLTKNERELYRLLREEYEL